MKYAIAFLAVLAAGYFIGRLHAAMVHKCFLLVRSCKGISGMILKCPDPKCGERYVITWPEMTTLTKDLNLRRHDD